MISATIITLLGKEFGLPIAKKIFSILGESRRSSEKFNKVSDAIQNGASTLDALRKTFGNDFDKALAQATNIGRAGWTYEAGRNDYVNIIDETNARDPIKVLRDELSINLDRIGALPINDEINVRNHFRGVFSKWIERYNTLGKLDDDAKSTFIAINRLLDGENKTFKDVLVLMKNTGLGSVGALLLIKAVLLATSTGVGLATLFTTFVFGIPLMTVATYAIPGIIVLVLSRYKPKADQTMSVCVGMAYKLLERHNQNRVTS